MKEAGENAARVLLENHAARHLRTRERLATQPTGQRALRVLHRQQALDEFADVLGLNAASHPLLSVALTHPGASDGQLIAHAHKSLAQLGSVLVELIAGELLLAELHHHEPSEFRNAELMVGRAREGSTGARAFSPAATRPSLASTAQPSAERGYPCRHFPSNAWSSIHVGSRPFSGHAAGAGQGVLP